MIILYIQSYRDTYTSSAQRLKLKIIKFIKKELKSRKSSPPMLDKYT